MKTIRINLQQTIFYFDKSEVCTPITAIFQEHKNLLLINTTYIEYAEEILLMVKNQFKKNRPTLLYTDSFQIDSWDDKFGKYNQSKDHRDDGSLYPGNMGEELSAPTSK